MRSTWSKALVFNIALRLFAVLWLICTLVGIYVLFAFFFEARGEFVFPSFWKLVATPVAITFLFGLYYSGRFILPLDVFEQKSGQGRKAWPFSIAIFLTVAAILTVFWPGFDVWISLAIVSASFSALYWAERSHTLWFVWGLFLFALLGHVSVLVVTGTYLTLMLKGPGPEAAWSVIPIVTFINLSAHGYWYALFSNFRRD